VIHTTTPLEDPMDHAPLTNAELARVGDLALDVVDVAAKHRLLATVLPQCSCRTPIAGLGFREHVAVQLLAHADARTFSALVLGARAARAHEVAESAVVPS